jgi:BNR/Asp-box repeat
MRRLSIAAVLITASFAYGNSLYWSGRKITCLAADPSSAAVIYAGTSALGAFKSIDGGNSWTHLTGLPDAIGAMAVDPARKSVIYVATTTGSFRSDDAGGHWKEISRSLAPVASIAVNARHIVLQAGLYGIIRSNDGGESWEEPGGNSQSYAGDVIFDSRNGNVAIATLLPKLESGADPAETLLLHSGDAGKSWRPIHRGIVDAILPAGRLFILTRAGLRLSDDAGATWRPMSALRDVTALAIDPVRSGVIYAAASDRYSAVYRSDDDGKTWKELYRFSHTIDEIVRTPRALFLRSHDRLFRTTDDHDFEIVGREITNTLRQTR